MDTSTGAGRDSRFNVGYNMLSGETSQDMYGSRPSTSINSGMSRSGMSMAGPCAPGLQRGLKRTASDVCFVDQDVSGRSNMGLPGDCSTDLLEDGFSPAPQKSTPPANGKKTKGRVKIKMEYIDNKLRRYTTFSKRKTGIMKKAYELSTLTGTQVMLLVASETGHVYTFATRKLQPMITSEAGKALIQTCLNSPDPCPSGGGDQRMSATGFEETELSYNIGDDEQKVVRVAKLESDSESDDMPSPRSVDDGDLDNGGDASGAESSGADSPRAQSPASDPMTFNLPDMIRAGIRNALQKSGSSGDGGPNLSEAHQQTPATATQSQPTSSSSLISASYPGVMYQTPQGLVYASPTTLPSGVILSLPPGLQLQPHGEANGTNVSTVQAAAAVLRQPQFIRLPFPMALSDPSVSLQTQTRNGVQEAADLSKGRK